MTIFVKRNKPIAVRQHLIVISLLMLLLLGSCKSSRNSVKIKPVDSETAIQPTPHRLTDSSVDTDMGQRLVSEARKWLGVPYRYGGNSRKGVDCSGMVVAVYRDVASLKLPRSSADQHRYCHDISRKNLEAGDLVFFKGSSKGKVSHVGIYIGDNKMIHASSSRGVIVSDLGEKYYTQHYHASGRVEGITFAATGNSPDKKKKQKKTKQKTPPAEEKIVTPADGGNEIAVAPEIKELPARRREAIEMSLDEFIARENRRQAIADSIAAARRDSIAAAVSAPVDTIADTTPPPRAKKKEPLHENERPDRPSSPDDTTTVADDKRERVSRGFKGAL